MDDTACEVAGQSFVLLSLYTLTQSAVVYGNADTTIDNTTHRSTTVRPLNISNVCPGIDDILRQNTSVTILRRDASHCFHGLPDYTEHQGVVYGMCGQSNTFCRLRIQVPHKMFVRVRIQRLAYWCGSRYWRIYLYCNPYKALPCFRFGCGEHTVTEMYVESSAEQMYIRHHNSPIVQINIEAVNNHSFVTVYTSAHNGYLILPLMEKFTTASRDAWQELRAPSEAVFMVSFAISMQDPDFYDIGILEFIYKEPNAIQQHIVRVCDESDMSVKLFLTSALHIYPGYYFKDIFNLKILFSIHLNNDQPNMLPSGLFNCSVDHYPNFKHHLDCNLRIECEEGQDETEHCPFSSPGCQGLVASRNKCFKYVKLDTKPPYLLAVHECQKMGGSLASVKTRMEQNDMLQLFKNFKKFYVLIGFSSGWYSVPFMYSKFRKWSDNTVVYNMDIVKRTDNFHYWIDRRICAVFIIDMERFIFRPIQNQHTERVVCEQDPLLEHLVSVLTVEYPVLHLSLTMFTQTQQILSHCPDGHVTLRFLSCDPRSHCGQTTSSKVCTVANTNTMKDDGMVLPRTHSVLTFFMFLCDEDKTPFPYTLVCDFRSDCPDKSDELFCKHPSCTGTLCDNNQCVKNSQHCNDNSDCLDDSDEAHCSTGMSMWQSKDAQKTQRLVISLDGTGYFVQKKLESNVSCPDSHYWCTEHWQYCLPVYTRCNGFSDCTYGEDEQDCDTAMCPGFYQCHGSKVCVHADHLCDGWGQCPQHDDERLCDMTCAEDCWCQGHSFLCLRPFSADLFPQLRYIDATGSGMTLTDFSHNTYLIYLSLSNCSLLNVSGVNLPNLQFINLSYNLLSTVDMTIFLKLQNLIILLLANNPLICLANKPLNHYNSTIEKLDISKTRLQIVSKEMFVNLSQVQYLNMSFSAIKNILSNSFEYLPHLVELDMRGNPIKTFPLNFASKLTNLKCIFSPDFRMCCEDLLPKKSNEIRCLSPQPIFSSCNHLLPNDLFRLFFWILSIFAIFGNLVCFIARSMTGTVYDDNSIRFMSHFHLAKICMGSHVGILTVANEIYNEHYVLFEKTWTKSVACKMAGFLSLLSSEVSVLMLLFITLNHIIVICFPLAMCTFNQRRTAVASALTWCVGLSFSVIPFLPGLSHWGLEGQSGLCCLALSPHNNSNQEFRWFTVSVVVNFILCSAAAIGQFITYRRSPMQPIVIDPTKKMVNSTVHLSSKMCVTDVVSWVFLGLTSMMSLSGVAVSDKVRVYLAVFMFPLSSALNPLVFVWTVEKQRRQHAMEERLLQVMKSRLACQRKLCSNNKNKKSEPY